MELPSDSFVGHVVGRNGCFVRRLLAEHDSVCRIRVQGAKVRIVGKQESLQEDVEAIAVKVRYQVFTTIYQSWKYLTAAARGRRPRRAGVTLPLGFPPPRASEAEEEDGTRHGQSLARDLAERADRELRERAEQQAHLFGPMTRLERDDSDPFLCK